MKSRIAIWTTAWGLLATSLLAGCGGGDTTGTAEPTPEETSQSASESPSGQEITSTETELGTFLVDQEGKTLYLFTKDSPGKSVCEGDCLAAWPPLEGQVTAGEGVDESLIGSIKRSDGSTQATYGDWPLYYFTEDAGAGDVNGQGVGDVWYVVSPEGEAIGAGATSGNEIKTRSSDLGTFLVDSKGMTLYLFTKDSPGKSVCEGDCLTAWPPLQGEVTAGAGVDESLIGSIKRSDGSTQASYGDWPLYYWMEDKRPGDTTGQGVGDVWYVVSPEGKAIK
jgi:predicted lipoprotein with Yx(FWY)xxD motif